MKSDQIIDNKLYIHQDLGISLEHNSKFQINKNNIEHFANQLLLYDRIIIPTKDFGIVPVLINWMGLDLFEKLLKSQSILFAHRLGLMSYQNNGNGISLFIIRN